jgi:hypothetical protein
LARYNTADRIAEIKANMPAAKVNGKSYSTVALAIDAAGNTQNKTVTLLKSTTENVTVPAGITLDLNGKTLTATNFTCNGILADSSDGNGMVATLPKETINVEASDLLLYDSEKIGYRVYSNFEIASHYDPEKAPALEEVNANTKRLWIKLAFDNEDAYRVIATGYSDIRVGAALTWTPDVGQAKHADLFFADKYVTDWAEKMDDDTDTKEYGFYINFTGFESLSSGKLELTPVVNAVNSATSIVHRHTGS